MAPSESGRRALEVALLVVAVAVTVHGVQTGTIVGVFSYLAVGTFLVALTAMVLIEDLRWNRFVLSLVSLAFLSLALDSYVSKQGTARYAFAGVWGLIGVAGLYEQIVRRRWRGAPSSERE